MAKALDLDLGAKQFLNTFGQREFYGFVGFIDLCGFSARTAAKSPKEVHDTAMHFLEPVIVDIHRCDAFIDKTIGDEVMFVLPEFEDEAGVPAVLRIEKLLGSLRRTARSLGLDFQMKMGLAYGEMYLGNARDGTYAEWTSFGEPVHLAKRVQSSATKQEASPLFGRFAVLESDPRALAMYALVIHNIKVVLDDFLVVDLGTVQERGVSPAACSELILGP